MKNLKFKTVLLLGAVVMLVMAATANVWPGIAEEPANERGTRKE